MQKIIFLQKIFQISSRLFQFKNNEGQTIYPPIIKNLFTPKTFKKDFFKAILPLIFIISSFGVGLSIIKILFSSY